jgi:hypothetical protein
MNIHITDFTGLCNRLESLAIALCIREYYPAEIYCRWPEADAFHIPDIHWNRGGWRRWNRTKIRELSEEQFCHLPRRGNLFLRGIRGEPDAVKLRQLDWIRRHIRLHPGLVRQAVSLFPSDQPVVGVHLRRGDFRQQKTSSHRALGDTWLRSTMDTVLEQHPETRFFLSHTGSPQEFDWIYERYDCFNSGSTSPYTYKGAAHASANHPILDLFCLACCDPVIVTPRSSFSHWATNILGKPATAIWPCADGRLPFKAHRPGLITLESWAELVQSHAMDVPCPVPVPPNVDWL